MRYVVVSFAIAAAIAASRVPAPRPVWSGPHVTLLGGPSPDGRYLSFVEAATGELALRDLNTASERRLTRKQHPGEFAYFSTIAPRNKSVAYAWFNHDGFYELRLIRFDGTGERTLFRNPQAGFVQPCDWSPDGRRILTLFFRKDNISQIAWIDAESGAVQILKSLNWVYPKKMDVSPDGRFIVYDNFAKPGIPERDIFLLNADGSRETRLIDHAADDLFPLWSEDGASILFASLRLGHWALYRLHLTDGKPAGEPERVMELPSRFLPLGVTEQGRYLYGTRTDTETVHITRLDQMKQVRLGDAYREGVFSPDGRRIAYIARRGAENFGQPALGLVIYTLGRDEPKALTPKLAHFERLRWLPDGSALLVSGSDNKGRGGLFRINSETGATTPLLQPEGAGYHGIPGEWSPAGALLSVHGTTLRQQDRILYQGTHPITNFALSRTGRLAFVANGTLYLLHDGKPEPLLKAPIDSIDWRGPDALIALCGGELWQIPVPGAPTRLTDRFPGRGPIHVHPGGEQITFLAGENTTQVWVLDKP